MSNATSPLRPFRFLLTAPPRPPPSFVPRSNSALAMLSPSSSMSIGAPRRRGLADPFRCLAWLHLRSSSSTVAAAYSIKSSRLSDLILKSTTEDFIIPAPSDGAKSGQEEQLKKDHKTLHLMVEMVHRKLKGDVCSWPDRRYT
ncbi:uncharacterized protein LOC122053216 isoform X2 [Zingiber officinale]|uniref:uncharacterized protein LOC122053216 isoform X2 n=1 Tax=Zingiber officinale TaxID=94328 RepID=UPI001C4C8363|nr:uncharacterized protein LOC122053216 isoform X2 [Zingiber officinale]XP_042471093.1 uncharacterized protein LOC122053216 isoform X2 [Zingiber officinale]